MSRKSKGINAERELIHLFWKNNWSSIRVAGSGNMKYPCPDIIAGNSLRHLAIECKTINDTKKYFTEDDLHQLREFSRIFGSESWLAVKFAKQPWYFITPEDLEKTETNYVITIDQAKTKGLLFEELLSH